MTRHFEFEIFSLATDLFSGRAEERPGCESPHPSGALGDISE